MTIRRLEYLRNRIEEIRNKYRIPPEKYPDPVPELLNPNYAYLECSSSVYIYF